MVAELAAAKQKYWDTSMDYYKTGLKYSQNTNSIHPYVMAKEIHDFLYEGAIDPKLTLVGWGGATCGHATARFLRANRPGQEIVCQYSFGAMGPDLSMMIARPWPCRVVSDRKQPTRARRACASPAMPE